MGPRFLFTDIRQRELAKQQDLAMVLIEREGIAKATPETIWKSCFEPMKWETWDADLDRLEDVSGKMANGTTMIFVLTDGVKVPTRVENCVDNERFTFRGKLGPMEFHGTVILTPVDDCATNIRFTIGIEGCLGAIFHFFKKEANVSNTEKGLENMIRISEEAQKSKSQT